MKKIYFLLMLNLSFAVTQAQVVIQNDSLNIKKQLFSIWQIDTPVSELALYIKGISNEYIFPRMIQDSENINRQYFDSRDTIISLRTGIYIAGVMISDTYRLFIFSDKDTIQIIPEYAIKKLIEYYIYYSKMKKYTDKQFLNELKEIIASIDRSPYDNSQE